MPGLSIEFQGLRELRETMRSDWLYKVPTRHFMKAVGAMLRQAAARESPKGLTKVYSRSWVEVYDDADPPMWVRVENTDQPKDEWIQFGTPPHIIEPLHPMEALFWPGAPHPFARVHHPGTKPNDVIGRAQIQANAQIWAEAAPKWNEEVAARWERRGGGDG